VKEVDEDEEEEPLNPRKSDQTLKQGNEDKQQPVSKEQFGTSRRTATKPDRTEKPKKQSDGNQSIYQQCEEEFKDMQRRVNTLNSMVSSMSSSIMSKKSQTFSSSGMSNTTSGNISTSSKKAPHSNGDASKSFPFSSL